MNARKEARFETAMVVLLVGAISGPIPYLYPAWALVWVLSLLLFGVLALATWPIWSSWIN